MFSIVLAGARAMAVSSAAPLLPPMASDLPLLRIGADAALAAGRHMTARLGKAEVLSTKLDWADLVTAVDGECQEIIEERIHALDRGTHLLLGEESVPPGVDAAMEALRELLVAASARPPPDATTSADAASGGSTNGADGEWLWIIDPIDGTTNFVQGLPLCAVSIGVADARSGARLGAIVLDPFRDELFCAWRGRGAYLNGEPIACSDVTALSDAVLCGCSPKLHAVGAAVRSSAALHVPPFSAAPLQPCTCLPAPLSYQRAHSNIAITRCAGWRR